MNVSALLVVVMAGASISSFAKDSAPPVLKYAAWKEVDSFSAEATAIDHGWAQDSHGRDWVDNDRYMSVRYQFDLKVTHPQGSSQKKTMFWDVENCMASGEVQEHSRGGAFLRNSDHHYTGSFKGAVKKGGSLRMDFDTGHWQIVTEGLLETKFHEIGHSKVELNGKVTVDNDFDLTENRIPGIFINGQLDAAVKPGVLIGTGVVQDIPRAASATRSRREYRVTMWPNYRDVECVVEIDKYDKWLPEANIRAANQPGSRLHVDAYLRPKDGGANLPLHARQFRFSLSNTSHEPGVAMNYPMLTKGENQQVPDDPHPDIRMALHLGSGELRDEGQEADVKPVANLRGQDSASIFVDAFDYGGYANLKVVCELEDGREVAGVLHTADGAVVDITVPKRSNGSKIADSWREKYKIGPNDAEDQDLKPTGDDNHGDGFSNYEEYRGFVIKGTHIRTNPTIKDIFIRNRIGPVAERGLSVFAQDTDLNMHFRLLEVDMPPSRVMNSNRSANSPRSTAEYQHGLILTYQIGGDYSVADSDAELCRPKNVKEVRVLWSPAFPGGKSKRNERQDKELAATIAHELCHAIGCLHHGESDPGSVVWLRKSRDVDGKTEWWFEERQGEWNEQTKQYDPSKIPGEEIRLFSKEKKEILASNPGDLKFPYPAWVGVYGGQHSGNDQCIMRYDCADAYILPDRPRVRYLSPGEPCGLDLCDSNVGTGINAASANPSRYSNAVTGNCVHRFAVRDDAPARPPGN